jgi:hypothetical protein
MMVYLFTGPAPLAQMVREELLHRGVGTDLYSEEPIGHLYGSVGSPAGVQSVVIPEEVAERHRAAIEEVLALVSEVKQTSTKPAAEP